MPDRFSENNDGMDAAVVNGGAGGELVVGLPDHLVVMVHGILGNATDWKFAAEQFVRVLPDKVVVHCSQRNVSKLTLDGVDVMGERLAEEVKEVVEQMPKVRKISFIAHSVGGLVARYAIGRLYEPPQSEEENEDVSANGAQGRSLRGTICGLEAANFITVATPHLGSRGNKQVPFLFGVPIFEKAACLVIHWIFRRTGRHLFLTDNEEGKLPLLQLMLTDCGDLYFMSALCAFRRRVAYANVGYDRWRTASIRRNCELPKWEDSLSQKYPHIVRVEAAKVPEEQHEQIPVVDDGSDVLEEKLASGLRRVSWERVDVSFHTSKRRFAAHSLIQVKDPFVHSEGVDCIMHMIDNFLC
ncbi:lipid droplet phospholipase 1 isoform X2 [Nymphaea colorata]|uniref:lipid droplet phospholipase 1 isoform X2 n=1 Tax=Nymphaea colorata TaxID=210225 RepID=UPI00129EE6A4|nr:lipid droplet phospholipase 1 isoform X2 [Nymphaea colorata]